MLKCYDLGITWIGYKLKKSNKMGKEDNGCIKIKYISLLKKIFDKKNYFLILVW